MGKLLSLMGVLTAGGIAGFIVTLIPWPSLYFAAFGLGMAFGLTCLAAGAVMGGGR